MAQSAKVVKANSTTGAKVPAGAKKPKDHQEKKAPKPKVEEVDGVFVGTVSGFEVKIETDVFDDFEFMGELRGVDQDATLAPLVLQKMLGYEQYTRVMDHLRDKKTGKVLVGDGVQFLADIVDSFAPSS